MRKENKAEARIYNQKIEIDPDSVKQLYAKRAAEKNAHIDAPTVLSSDADLENIKKWTDEEVERWLPVFDLNEESIVFEIAFGTGRMTKYLTPVAKKYIGIDYVAEFQDVVLEREDIEKKDNTEFYTISLQEFLEKGQDMKLPKFNRVFLSGGAFMYINDADLKDCISKLPGLLSKECLIYISEPIALEERLTLNSFYSDTMQEDYSAVYRTETEYKEMFRPLFEAGFELKISQEFFKNDFKKMKETKQWMFLLSRGME